VVLEVPVLHDGELLGTVSLHARADTDLAPDAEALVTDVTGMLGAVLRNALLTAELKEQVVALRRSRQRLVEAHDSARRGLERDLHDGAQARLVALRMGVAMAGAELTDTEDPELRQSSPIAAPAARHRGGRGHPRAPGADPRAATPGPRERRDRRGPACGDRGLPAAVDVDGDGIGRLTPAVEAAVYFACLEAIKNATSHAAARRVEVRLQRTADQLRFRVEDDGVGFDPARVGHGRGLLNLDDRIGGLGGILTVASTPGRGTRIEGVVPVQLLDSAR
jgi:two-component system, NarL family, sensor kinase